MGFFPQLLSKETVKRIPSCSAGSRIKTKKKNKGRTNSKKRTDLEIKKLSFHYTYFGVHVALTRVANSQFISFRYQYERNSFLAGGTFHRLTYNVCINACKPASPDAERRSHTSDGNRLTDLEGEITKYKITATRATPVVKNRHTPASRVGWAGVWVGEDDLRTS